MPDSFKYRLKKLPVYNRLILLGAVVGVIAVFLPWYRDIDKFKTGDMFLGITGPLYLAGLIVLLASLTSLALISLKLAEKPAPKLPVKEEHSHIFNSVLSLFMLILTASVYFHPKFGINVVNKSMGFGMIFSFVGAFFILAGAILALKKADVSFESEGHMRPLIDINDRVPQSVEKRDVEKIDVKNAVQESLENFTNGVKDTTDIYNNDRQ